MSLDFLSEEKLQKCITENQKIEAWFPVFQEYFPKYNVTTKERVAGFLSQTCVESLYWQKFSENLNYSATGLLKIFPKYFKSSVEAGKYARKPEMIANRVYGGRLGNGPEASGEGWKYRGRGAIQVTGKANYSECSKWLFGDDRLVDDPDQLAKTNGVISSACWYWTTHNLNDLADKQDMNGMTKRINGGTHGLELRKKLFIRMMGVL
jgi:putative chitinase